MGIIPKRRISFLMLLATAALVLPARAGGKKDTLTLAVHYDFFLSDGAVVRDASGLRHVGKLVNGSIVPGRRRNAVQFDGKGMIVAEGMPETLDPSGRAFALGAACLPTAGDGVIASMGDRSNGFCLFLKGRKPHFAIRSRGKLVQIADTEPLPLKQWSLILAGMNARGELWLRVNNAPIAQARGRFLAKCPAELFCVGADSGTPVLDGPTPPGWKGQLQEVRLYWGEFDVTAERETLKDWYDLSGCGCR
ncbi:MAG: hypothetical protein ACP5XB_20495 [Isosphaeraceae bacterium]